MNEIKSPSLYFFFFFTGEIKATTMAMKRFFPFFTVSSPSQITSRFFSTYMEKVGIQEFLNGVGKGVETHIPKIEAEIGDFEKLLVTRTLRLKKLGIPCKHRKLILRYTHKYRLGLWRPRAEPLRSKSA